MSKDFIQAVEEIRGTKYLGEEALPTEKNGIYHDIVEKTTENSDDTTLRPGAAAGYDGLYGSMEFMYYAMRDAGITSTYVESIQAGLNVSVDATDPAHPIVSATTDTSVTAHMNAVDNPHSVTKTQVGLDAVDNTSDADKPISDDTDAAIKLKEDDLGLPSIDGQVLSSTKLGNRSWITVSGGGGTWGSITGTLSDQTDLQNALDAKITSVVPGANTTVDNADPLNPIIASTTDATVTSHMNAVDNPHVVTKTQVGLSAVDNTADADKPVSTDTQTAIDDIVTTDVAEGTNLYYTDVRADARVQNAIVDTSASGTTVYSSSKVDAMVSGSLIYKGTWDASTNTPTISDGTGSVGWYYQVSTGGTQDLGSGDITFLEGNKVIHNGTIYQKSVESSTTWGSIAGTLSDQTDLQNALELKVDDTQVLTDVPAGALFTDTVYDDTAIQAEVDLNTAKTGISTQQATDITTNNAKETNIAHPLVEEAVPSGALFTDTVYDSSSVDTHMADSTIHFTQASISITESQISDLGPYEAADATILKDADIGIDIQAYDANIVSDASYVHTDNNYTTAEQSKLAGIEAGANDYVHPITDGSLHVPATELINDGKVLTAGSTAGSFSWETPSTGATNLSTGTVTSTTYDINSDSGTDVTIVEATSSTAGLLGSTKFDEIVANTAKVTNVDTALTLGTVSVSTVDVNSDGTNVTLPSATNALAGVATAAHITNIETNATDIVALGGLIEDLETAQAKIIWPEGSANQPITGATQILDFDTESQSSDTDIFEVDDATNTIIIKRLGSYTTTTSIVFISTTNNGNTDYTQETRNSSTLDVYSSKTIPLAAGNNDLVAVTYTTLVDVTDEGLLPLTLERTMSGNNTDFEIQSFSIIMEKKGGSAGGGTVMAHSDLLGLSDADSHPVAAITGLTAVVDKVAGVEDGANNYIHPTTAGNIHLPAGGSTGQIVSWSADGTGVWGNVSASGMVYDPTNDPTTSETDLQLAIVDHGKSIEERVSKATGAFSGGVLSAATSTTFSVTAGTGVIVDGYTDPENSSFISSIWIESLNNAISMDSSGVGAISILVDSSNNIVVVDGKASSAQYRQNIYLGRIFYENNIIVDVVNAPVIAGQTAADLVDNIKLTETVSGFGINPSSDLSVWIDEGSVFGLGLNWTNDRTNPNSITVASQGTDVSPIGFAMYDQNMANRLATVDMPASYDNAGTITALGGKEAVIHRVFLQGIDNPSIVVLYGQNSYGDGKKAKADLLIDESSTVVPDEFKNMFFIGWVCIGADAVDFSNADKAWIANALDSTTGNSVAITSHNQLDGRSDADAHPISAITGLAERTATTGGLLSDSDAVTFDRTTRLDKIIAMQDIVTMVYDSGSGSDLLGSIDYSNNYDEVFSYDGSDNLQYIDHQIGGVNQSYSTLAYTGSDLTSVTYTDSARV